MSNSFEQKRKRYWPYLFLAWFFLFLLFAFSSPQLPLGNLGGRKAWLLEMGLPTVFRDYLLFGVLALILKWLLIKIFPSLSKFSKGITVLAVIFIVSLSFLSSSEAGFFHFDVNFFFLKNFAWLKIFYGALLVVLIFVFFINFSSYLLKIPQPNFWKNNLVPLFVGYALFIFILPLLLASFNFLMVKNQLCQKVIGRNPQENCFYQLALKSQDKSYCQKIKDHGLFSQCQNLLPLEKTQEKGIFKPIHNFLLSSY